MSEIIVGGKPILAFPLPFSALRQELDPLLEPDFIDQIGIGAYDMIANIEGFELLAPGDLGRGEFRCAQFVFATRNREPWAKEDEYIPVFNNPLEFFNRKGYRSLLNDERPITGDIITYGFLRQNEPRFKLIHMGLVHDDKSVVSKFNEGHVLKP